MIPEKFDTVDDYTSRAEHWNFAKYAWFIQKLIGKWDTVLDVGCALGYLMNRLGGYGIATAGIERDNRFAEFNHPNVPAGSIKYMDISESYLKTLVMFDCVCCFDVLEHIVPEKEDIVVYNLQAFSKKYIAIGVATHDKGEDVLLTEDEGDPTHVNIRPSGYWQKKFSQFEVAKQETDFFNQIMKAKGIICDNDYFVLKRIGV